MSSSKERDIRVSDEQLVLLIESVEMLRVYQQGFTDAEGRLKLKDVERLESRLRRKLTVRGSGAVGNYAEKL